jgi:hypothetical protein
MSIESIKNLEDDKALVHYIWRTFQLGPAITTADALCQLLQLVYRVWAGLAHLWDLENVVEDLRLYNIHHDQRVLLQLLCGFSLDR